jgi:hypothetical protein
MDGRFGSAFVMFAALALLVVPAWGSALRDIPPGGDIFIGEQNLNLTGIPSGTTLSWYTGPQVPGVSVPAATIFLGNARDFYAAPSDFAGHTGTWYIGNETQAGFVVHDPYQAVSVYDQQSGNDVTNKSVPAGDWLTFRIETNMHVIPAQRPGAEGFFTLMVRTPDGTVYTRLFQDDSTELSLVNLSPDTMPWYWSPLSNNSGMGWSTGWWTGLIGPDKNRVYPAGRYSFWTECNLNGIKDNYKDKSGQEFTGKTVSALHDVTIKLNKVNIEASNTSVSRSRPFTVTITGKPNNVYYLWVEDTNSLSGEAGDQPPVIISSQDGVRMDPKAGPWPIGQYVPEGSTTTIQKDVAQNYGRVNVHGTVYYASVTLSASGSRTVGFSTTKDTRDRKYTIRVERPEPYNPPASNTGSNRTFMSGKVDIKVEKGGGGGGRTGNRTPVFTRTQAYFQGEAIRLTGTNSETDNTYLFITGPNLPADGGQMADPRAAPDPDKPETLAIADVQDDGTWEYRWQTANLNMDAGTYTIYAVTTPDNRSTLADALFATVPVLIRKPFISARTSAPAVAAGDDLFIRGTASGQPDNGIAVWIFGKNTVIYQTTNVYADGSFGQEISRGQTADMDPGQYFVVAQHPMYNGIFDVWPDSSVPGSGTRDLVEGSYPVSGSTLFKIQGAGSLQGSDAAEALVRAIGNPSIDDMYATDQFLVEIPKITILPVGEKRVGDRFTIAGTTNLAIGDDILVEVISSSFGPTQKTQSGEFSGVSGTVKVREGAGGLNEWSFPVNATAFVPDEYLVRASGITVTAQASTWFDVARSGPGAAEATRPIEGSTGAVEAAGNATATNATACGCITESGNTNATNTTEGEEEAEDSGITITSEPSALFSAVELKPTPVPTIVATIAPVVKEATTVITTEIPVRTTVPTTRTRSQPGFGALVAMAGLAGVVFIVGCRR